MKMLTLEDRKELERMWSENAAPVKVAATLDISLCTVYAELKWSLIRISALLTAPSGGSLPTTATSETVDAARRGKQAKGASEHDQF